MAVSSPARRLDDQDGPLTVKEVATMLRVDEETVRTWLRSGRVRGSRLGSGSGSSPWRIPRSEIEKLDLEV